MGEDVRWARAVALGGALVVLGGAVLDVTGDLRERVAICALVVVAVLIVGWGWSGRGQG